MLDAATGDHYETLGGINNATSGVTVIKEDAASKIHMFSPGNLLGMLGGHIGRLTLHNARVIALIKMYIVNTSNVATSGHNMDA